MELELYRVAVKDLSSPTNSRVYYVEAADLTKAAKRAEKQAREDSLMERPQVISTEWLGAPLR